MWRITYQGWPRHDASSGGLHNLGKETSRLFSVPAEAAARRGRGDRGEGSGGAGSGRRGAANGALRPRRRRGRT